MAWIALVLALACGGNKQEPEPAPTAPVEVAEPEDASGSDDCVEACKQSRMAEAIAWEQIERDCEAQCSGTAPSLEGGGL